MRQTCFDNIGLSAFMTNIFKLSKNVFLIKCFKLDLNLLQVQKSCISGLRLELGAFARNTYILI